MICLTDDISYLVLQIYIHNDCLKKFFFEKNANRQQKSPKV